MGTGTNIYLGIIEDRKDPQMMGRFRVRVVGIHSANKQELPTAALPWATAMLPTTSPGLNGIGSNPFLLEGSWAVVMFMDSEFQEPLILGSIAGNTTEKRNQDMGFSDPRGFYPRDQFDEEGNKVDEKDRKAEPDLNKRARGEELDAVLRKDPNNQERAIVGDNEIPLDDPYAAKYPYNHVFASESGHFIELDDTPHYERVNIQHRTGSFIEIHPNGDMRIRAKNLFNSSAHQVINVDGQCDLTVAQDCNVIIQGDTSIRAIGNVLLEAEQDVVGRIKGQTVLNLEKEVTINAIEELSVFANSAVRVDTTKNIWINAIGEDDEKPEKEIEGFGITITTNKHLEVNATEDVDFNVGGDFTIHADGDISLNTKSKMNFMIEDTSDDDAATTSNTDPGFEMRCNTDIFFKSAQNIFTHSDQMTQIKADMNMLLQSDAQVRIDADNLLTQSTLKTNINAGDTLGMSSINKMNINAGGVLDLTSRSTANLVGSSRTNVIGGRVHLNPFGRGGDAPAGITDMNPITPINTFNIDKRDIEMLMIPQPIIPNRDDPQFGTMEPESENITDVIEESKTKRYALDFDGETDVEVRFPPWQYKAPELEDITLEVEEGGLEEPQDPQTPCLVTDDDCNTVLPEIERTPLYKTTDVTDEDMNGRITETFRSPGTIRNKPLQRNLKQYIANAADQANVYVEIYSAGQDKQGTGRRRVGSHRHDDLGSGGRAADIYLFSDKQRTKRLRSDSNQAKTFIDAVISQGAQSIGAGHGYMGSYGIHVDVVDQTPAGKPAARYWGASGRRRNAWPFLKNNPRLT